MVHTNSDSAKREKVCHLCDLCTYDVVRREGVKFQDLPTSDGQHASGRSARSWDAKLNEYGIDIGGFTMVPP